MQFIEQMVPLWESGNRTRLVALGGDTFFAPKEKNLGEIIKEKNKKFIEPPLLDIFLSAPVFLHTCNKKDGED